MRDHNEHIKSRINKLNALRERGVEPFGGAFEYDDTAASVAERYGSASREALEAERWTRLHPDQAPRVPYVAQVLGEDGGPVIAATDWMRSLPDMVARWLPRDFVSLGTDGFGRSDTRESLRAFFEVDAPSIAAAALSALARSGAWDPTAAAAAIHDLGLDPERAAPFAV